MMKIPSKLILIIGSLILISCSSPPPGYSKAVLSDDGIIRIADTPAKQRELMGEFDYYIGMEAKNVPVPSGLTWNEAWIMIIKSLQEGQENSQKYIDYIIKTRHESGLPKLIYNEQP